MLTGLADYGASISGPLHCASFGYACISVSLSKRTMAKLELERICCSPFVKKSAYCEVTQVLVICPTQLFLLFVFVSFVS